MWLSRVNWDKSSLITTQYSLKFYVCFSLFIVLQFLHCGSCFLFVWARNSKTAISRCFFDVSMDHYQFFDHFSVNWNDIVLFEFYSMLLGSRVWEKSLTPLFKGFSGLWQFLATESPLKMMKNAFYFASKTLIVLKIFKFLSWLFGHVSKRLD